MHVAQGMHGVCLRLGVDVRHPNVVEQHLDLRIHALHSEVKSVVRGDRLHGDEHEDTNMAIMTAKTRSMFFMAGIDEA